MEFILELKSKLNVNDTLQKVKTSLKENGFGTLFELNFKDKFAEHDMTFDYDFFVLEVCNPKQAKRILDISTDIGYFLPCKVAVYDGPEGVKVGLVKPTALLHMISEDMIAFQIAHEVENVIVSSLEDAIK